MSGVGSRRAAPSFGEWASAHLRGSASIAWTHGVSLSGNVHV